MKRSGGCFIAVMIALMIPVLLIYIPQIVNDFACMIYRAEIEANFRGNDEIEVVKIVHACGNTSGTGDHTELWVGILIKTDYTYEELVFALADSGVDDISQVNELDIWQNKFGISAFENKDGYYILEFIKSAPLSWFDLRGA